MNASTEGSKLILERLETASVLRILRLHSPPALLAPFLLLTVRLGRRLLRLQFARCRSVQAEIQDYRRMLPVSPRIY